MTLPTDPHYTMAIEVWELFAIMGAGFLIGMVVGYGLCFAREK